MQKAVSAMFVALRLLAAATGIWFLLVALWVPSGYSIVSALVSGFALVVAAVVKDGKVRGDGRLANSILVGLVVGTLFQVLIWYQFVVNRVSIPEFGGFVWSHLTMGTVVLVSYGSMFARIVRLRSARTEARSS